MFAAEQIETAKDVFRDLGYGEKPEEPPPPNGPDDYFSGSTAERVTVDASAIPHTIADWLARDLPPPDRVIGEWLTTTSRVIINAPTGLGKTNFVMALCAHAAAGQDFLHWRAHRPFRVLFIDGEMSRRLLRFRLEDVVRRLGFAPEHLHLLSHEDLSGFQPLNTPGGQAYIRQFIEQIGGVDLIVFDNIMSLIAGDQKDEEGWQLAQPLVLWLTKQAIGQIWVHHTGHDKTHGYGTKTREWKMDTVLHLTEEKRADTDLSFTLKFEKARERTPATRLDFQDVKIALVFDEWRHQVTDALRPTKVSPLTGKALDALTNVLASEQAVMLPGNRRAAHRDHWQAECALLGLIDPSKPNSARTLFNKFRREAVAANRIACETDYSWMIK
jgi:AAA domain